MLPLTGISKKPLKLLAPDYNRKRAGNHLLIWKNLPHWMVIDDEFHSLLNKFNGSRSLQNLLQAEPKLSNHKKQILFEVRNLKSLGVLYEHSRLASKPSDQTKIPIESIALNITKHCNLKCQYCYNHENLSTQTKASCPELTADEIITFLNQLKPFLSKTPALNILGGEPLLAPDKLLRVAGYARKQGFNTLVSSNGTRISEDFAKKASKLDIQVQVSVDGHNPALNDPLRGQGIFTRIEEGLKILVKNKAYTIISMVCCKDNFPYLKDYYKWAKSIGVNEARFIPLKKMGAPADDKLSAVSVLDMIKQASRIFSDNPHLAALAGRDCFSIIANTCRYSNKRISCGTGLQTLLLDADGSIYPCLNTNIPEFKAANIRDKNFSFRQIWENSPALKRIRTNSRIDSMNAACSECTVRYWCLGGCRGETYANTGRLNAPSNNCPDIRQSIIEMFWILAEYPDIIKPKDKIG